MSDKKILLTRDGLNELQAELRILREEKRVEIADKLKEAISYGDLSENAEYQAARDDQAQMELRIAELEEMLKPGAYEIIDEKRKKTGINVGSVVTLEETEKKETITYTIVGSQEASILDGKISNESPIGRSLIGKNTGDHGTRTIWKNRLFYPQSCITYVYDHPYISQWASYRDTSRITPCCYCSEMNYSCTQVTIFIC